MDSLARPNIPQFETAFHSTAKVQGYTHDFYKYPARFSPHFVRFFLNALTEPGDYVLDPFMGGGTTIVEASASGRRAVGSDINCLARFVTKVKTTPLSKQDISAIRSWIRDVRTTIAKLPTSAGLQEMPVCNMPIATYSFFKAATGLVNNLQFPRRRHFARCAVLRVGQWALDAKTSIPDTPDLMDRLEQRVDHMLDGLTQLASAARGWGIHKNKVTATRHLLSYAASNARIVYSLRNRELNPKLVLTSPPYPGVHVLYHRWQVLGRRETPAPYWIADIRDGQTESFYTMGGRSAIGLDRYFAKLTAAFQNIGEAITPDATVVQLVAFSDAESQLPRYLESMSKAGFEETSAGGIDSQQVRSVPNRKWYNQHRLSNDASREVLLIHRLAT